MNISLMLFFFTMMLEVIVQSLLRPLPLYPSWIHFFPTLPSMVVEVTSLNREETRAFISTYQSFFGRDPRDYEIKDNLKLETHSASVDWLRPLDSFQIIEIPRRSTDLVELDDASEYFQVDYELLGTIFALDSHAVVMGAIIEVCRLSDWLVLPVESGKRICGSFRECLIPFYGCLFIQINLWLPLTGFEKEVLMFFRRIALSLSMSVSAIKRGLACPR